MEWKSPRNPWWHTTAAWTRSSPQSTGVGCWSTRQFTNPRYTTWDFRGQWINALAPSLDARNSPARGTAYALTSTGSTGGIGSEYWRNTPTPSLGASAAGSNYQQGGSITATTRQRNVRRGNKGASGARHYNAALRQVGSRSRSTLIPYHHWSCFHTWVGQLPTTTAIGRRYT